MLLSVALPMQSKPRPLPRNLICLKKKFWHFFFQNIFYAFVLQVYESSFQLQEKYILVAVKYGMWQWRDSVRLMITARYLISSLWITYINPSCIKYSNCVTESLPFLESRKWRKKKPNEHFINIKTIQIREITIQEQEFF